MTQVLVADPQKSICNALKERLEEQGCKVNIANQKQDTLDFLARLHPDLVLCERSLFSECYTNAKGAFSPSKLPTIILSDEDSVNSVVSMMQCGAIGYLTKPIDMNKLNSLLKKISASENKPNSHNAKSEPKDNLIEITGTSSKIIHIKNLIDKVAPSNARVLILGANGTGKELVAHWLHQKSSRLGSPFIEVNCAAIPSELIESELFGHEKGAFTSAIKQRKGKFEQADGGTLFLDEIGDMSLSAQAKVLRALQQKRISRVGSDKDLEVNVRVIAATNKDLKQEIINGNFREDLYHRLSVIVINVPLLDEHKEDIPMLVECFMNEICKEYEICPKKISPEAMQKLTKMHFSGNIRELRNVIERLIILSEETITPTDVELYANNVSFR
ncbi:MAG: sigma-54 dependent transcriptional regulator [Rikenellaceae bacterium]